MTDYVERMTDALNPSNLLNPFALWTDMGLRALDLTVSSTQNLGEGVDRFTRAGASAEATGRGLFNLAAPAPESGPTSSLLLGAQVQRSMLELMSQGWIQWMATLGNLVSLGAGRRLSSVTRRNLPAQLTSGELVAGDSMTAHTRAQPDSTSYHQRGRRTETHVEREPMEHALASTESHRRRTGSSRGRGTRSTRAGSARSGAKSRSRRA